MLLMHDVIHIKILTAVFGLNSPLICVLGTRSPWSRASGEPDGSFNTLHQFAEVVYTVKLLQSSSLFFFARLKCKLSTRIDAQEGYIHWHAYNVLLNMASASFISEPPSRLNEDGDS